MAIWGVSGPSSGLSRFLNSLATSGTTPSSPVLPKDSRSAAASSFDRVTGKNVDSPNGAAQSTHLQTRPQELASLIQTTINKLNSDQTQNPLDALRNIESAPGLDGLLGQLNVDPQQFRSDFLSSLTRSPSGAANISQVFQSVPAGQNLDTLA
jgi:hypothetical protein